MFGAIRTKKMVHDGVGYDYLFPNGYGASVVMDTGFLHGGKRDLWELAVLKDGYLCYDTDITNDVIGHLNDPEVDQLLERIANLEETTV